MLSDYSVSFDSTQSSCLYIVPTPIGNRQDITQRALDVLATVDCVAAEDTRTSGMLLKHYGIHARLLPLHEHNESRQAAVICELLAKGQRVALVSDAGTPLISDPGSRMLTEVIAQGYQVVPLPGACAAICALSASGLDARSFLFIGFLPAKSGQRLKQLESLKQQSHTLIFYEAARRLTNTVADMIACVGAERQVVLARELSKIHEEIIRTDLATLQQQLLAGDIVLKGECVLLLEGASQAEGYTQDAELDRILSVLMQHTTLKSAVQIAVELTGRSKSEVYDYALKLKSSSA